MSQPFNLSHARLDWSDPTTPVATEFDDVYFSRACGLDESAYVFMAQNRLPERWQGTAQPKFVIAETGFGTGLNFLLSWSEFVRSREIAETEQTAHCQRLHFISFEKYPLSREDLNKALSVWPQLSTYSAPLLAQYPPAVAGCHRLIFDGGQVVLDLWLGDVNHWLPQINASATSNPAIVNAWYLDGFAPAKNPEMWQPALFQQMARLSAPQASVATFTAAGIVRRGLLEAGFNMAKVKGFGRKREMLAGQFNGKLPAQSRYPAPEPANRSQPVTVIGNGIAAAVSVYALAARGIASRVISDDPRPGSSASGNRQGAIYPLLHVELDAISRFFTPASLFAVNQIRALAQQDSALPQQLNGVLQLAFNPRAAQRQEKLLASGLYPAALVAGCTATEASTLAGLELPHPALFYPNAGWVSPTQLCQQLFHQAAARVKVEHIHSRLEDIVKTELGWQLQLTPHTDGTQGAAYQLNSDCVLVCAGHRSQIGPLKQLPLTPIRGQVSHIAQTVESASLLRVLCYEGYMTPPHNGEHCIGSSFKRLDLATELRAEEARENISKLQRCLAPVSWPEALKPSDTGKVGFRCASPDHLPLLGELADMASIAEQPLTDSPQQLPGTKGLWTLTGLGSRGLTSVFLAAEQLASQLCGEPEPLPLSLADSICAKRFVWRQLKQQAEACGANSN